MSVFFNTSSFICSLYFGGCDEFVKKKWDNSSRKAIFCCEVYLDLSDEAKHYLDFLSNSVQPY